jgi:hypothetical protein
LIEQVFFSAGKQHDDLKKRTMDKMLENTLKAEINTKLPTCDDKGVFTDDDDTYRKHKYPTLTPTVVRRLVGERVQRRWLSYGTTSHITITVHQMIVSNALIIYLLSVPPNVGGGMAVNSSDKSTNTE